MKRMLFYVLAAVLLLTPGAMAANHVEVESKTVAKGAAGVTIGIKLTNDLSVRSVTVPLMLRSTAGGGYITALSMSYGDRLPSGPGNPLSELEVSNQYSTEDGTCKNHAPGGFGTIDTSGVDFVSPDAVLFSRNKIWASPELPPGSDVTGSMILTVDVNNVDGAFEIDTTCANPANHLLYVSGSPPLGLAPTFTKGVITIGTGGGPTNNPPTAQCQDVTVDADSNCQATVAAAAVDNGSSDTDGDPISLALHPPGPYSLGSTPVWLVVTDTAGASDSCQATITVVDNTPPVAVCPGDIAVGNDAGQCNAVVDYADNGSTDNCGIKSIIFTPPSGSTFDVGTTPVQMVVTDDAGNADTCTFNVTVNDTERPVAVCPGDTTLVAPPGGCTVAVNYGDAGSTDNCGISDVTFIPPSGSFFARGTAPVTMIVTDSAGNADTCSFSVTIRDLEPPVAVCHSDTTVLVGAQDTAAVVTYTSTVNDNCPGASINCSPPSGSTFPLGETIVTCIATDPSGNTDICSFTVNVTRQTVPPVALCIDVEVDADSNCQAMASIDDGSNDPDGGSVTIVQDPPGPYSLGKTVVKLYVTDDEGDADTCQATVTVVDNTPPVIVCAGDTAVSNDSGKCGATVVFPGHESVSDNCHIDNVYYVPSSGSFFDVGVTDVMAIVIDDAGNADTCAFTVTVNDTEPPVATCPDDIVIGNDPDECGSPVSFQDNGSTDNCGIASIVFDPPSGSTFDVGQTTVQMVVTDSAGNADTCSFSVTVLDTEGPVAQCPGDTVITLVSDSSTTVNWTSSVSDNCPGATIACTPPSGSVFVVGTTRVTCIATDAAGNADTCSFTVTVNSVQGCDNALPIVSTDTLCFYANECDTTTLCDTLTIDTDTPECPVGWSASFDAPWIVSVTPGSGTSPTDVEVCVDPTGLAPGFYTDTIGIWGGPTGPGRIPPPDAHVVVKLTVNEVVPALGLDSAFYVFNATACEPPPPSQTLNIFNANPDACSGLAWTESHNQAWLTVDPVSGTTPSTVDLSVDPTGLSAGVYTDTIQIDAPGAVGSPGYVIVELHVSGSTQRNASVWVSDTSGAVGDTVPVMVNFCNDFPASGISLGLHYNSSAIRIVGASFAGSRVETIDTIATLDDVNQTICLAAFSDPSPAIDTGCGLLATLYFEIVSDECPQEVAVSIDTMTIGQGCGLLMTDECLDSVHPDFAAGSVTIQCLTCRICGTITDENGNPLESATVELWYSYPNDGPMPQTHTTGPQGRFCLDAVPGTLYDVRVYRAGYCTQIVRDVECSDQDLTIALEALPEIPTQPHVADWWSENATVQGVPLMPGDVITAVDPDGVICGVSVVTTAGSYLIHVVADDSLTVSVDEGAEPGDQITLLLNCECPLPAPGSWQAETSTQFDADFDCGKRTIDIPLCDVWTLISFNVLPPVSDVDTVLNSIAGQYQHLLSATCNDGNISWDKDRPSHLNDLQTMDPFHGYWVKTIGSGVGPITVEGAAMNPDEPLDLCQGWNVISYLPPVDDERGHALDAIDGLYEHVFTAECDGIISWDRNRPPQLNDLTCMRPGYGYWIKMDTSATQQYPTSGYNCPQNSGSAKPVNITRNLIVTPLATDFWSAADPSVTGLRPGDVITVRTQGGVICGECVVTSDGMFLVHVYGDDPATDAIEGAVTGERLVFEVNGQEAQVTGGSTTWYERRSTEITIGSTGAGQLPTDYNLQQNYPNPFNPSTSIAFRLPEATDVTLTVYNVLGQLVRTIHSGYLDAGEHMMEWDGRHDNGTVAQSGIYFYRLQTSTWSETKKMTLLK